MPDTTHRSSDTTHQSDRSPESRSHVDTARILHQNGNPDEQRAAFARHDNDRNRSGGNTGLPEVHITNINRQVISPQQMNGRPYDDNHDGNLNREELERHLNDRQQPGTIGWVAETPAVLRRNQTAVASLNPADGTRDISSVDMSRLSQLPDNHPLVGRLRADLSAAETYGRNERLYDRRLGLVPEAVQQGHVQNSALMATLTSMASNRTGQDFLIDRIRPDGHGGYQVRFGNGQTIDTERPTSHEMAVYAQDTRHGIWPSVVERALGIARHSERLRPQEGTENMTAPYVFEAIIGNRGLYTHIDRMEQRTDDYMDSQFQRLMPSAMAMVADTRSSAAVADRVDANGTVHRFGAPLQGNHTYAVVGYNPRTREVDLRDPRHTDVRLRLELVSFRSQFSHLDAVQP